TCAFDFSVGARILARFRALSRIFDSRWGHSFSPAIAPLSVGGSKRGSKGPEISVEDDALTERDPELLDLRAERRPGEGRVDADDVPARAVADGLEEVAASAVDLGEGHEGAPEVVPTAGPELEE